MKGVFKLALVVLVLLSIWCGYKWNEARSYKAATVPILKMTSLAVNNVMVYEAGNGSKISVKDYMALLEGNAADIDKKVIELQALGPAPEKSTEATTIDYLKACQHFQRRLFDKTRTHLALNVAAKIEADNVGEVEETGGYGSPDGYYAQEALNRSQESVKTAKDEYAQASEEFYSSADSLLKTYRVTKLVVPESALIDAVALEKIVRSGWVAK